MNSDLRFVSYAKCILTGEHSVLRGVPALVFPVKGCTLAGQHYESDELLQIDFAGDYGNELSLIFWGVLEEACKSASVKRDVLKGQIIFKNNIPIGGGLGASAAICVCIARLFQHKGYITNEQIYEFARGLENLFHGESSGVDIAASMAASGLAFTRDGERKDIEMSWKPKLYVSYSGAKGVTLDCVNKVKELHKSNPPLGLRLDQQMKKAFEKASRALGLTAEQGFDELAAAMDLAKMCFHQWGLINEPLQSEMSKLLGKGALAVKPTGSGLGGYVLSLWSDEPCLSGLIPVIE